MRTHHKLDLVLSALVVLACNITAWANDPTIWETSWQLERDHDPHGYVPAHDQGLGHVHHGVDNHGHVDSHDYDSVFPYERHHGQEGHRDIGHAHSGHFSVDGYPFVHGIRTEIDFIERALEMDLAFADGADENELEFEAELVWAFNDHFVFILGAPLIHLDPLVESNQTGVGDLEVGFQFLAFNGTYDIFFTALNMTVPTGDADRGLGSGVVVFEPTAMWLHDFGHGNYVQSRLAFDLPVGTDEDLANGFAYDIALFHTFVETECFRVFRFLTPIFELNGFTALNGPDSGETAVDFTGGVRWLMREEDEIGFGISFPITNTNNFDYQAIFSYRLHF